MKKIITLLSLMILMVTIIPAQNTHQMSNLQEKLWKAGFGIPQQPIDAPEFSAKDIAGKQISLSSQKGKVILLNLWATWCPPCREEMPSMERLYQTFEDRDFTILAISTPNPPSETKKKIVDFITENAYTFPVLLDDSKEISYQYGSGSIPTSWIIDTDGKIVARFVGGMEWDSKSMIQIFEKLIP